MAITFNGDLKLITLTSGTTVLDVVDCYSRWKEWMLIGDNSKYPEAFISVGGNDVDTGAGTKIPAYIYVTNGWRIQPQAADHTLKVINGILLLDGGGDPFINPAGSHAVKILYQQPVQAITTTSSATNTALYIIGPGTIQAELGKIITLDFVVLKADTGAVGSPDGGPSCYVFDGSNDTPILTPPVVQRGGYPGCYRVNINCTIENEFTVNGVYGVIVTATKGIVETSSVVATLLVIPPIPRGLVVEDVTNSTGQFKTNLPQTANNYWKRALLLFLSGSLEGQVVKVGAYNGSSKVITLENSTLTNTPSPGDLFILVNK